MKMFKKLFLCTLALLLVFCAAAYAEGFDGEGTQENPYLIADADDLMLFAAVMNDDDQYADYNDCYFLQAADIALNDVSGFEDWGSTPPANAWTPIGYYHGFSGVFDGNGHTISGLYIDQAVCKDENGHVMDKFGLFGVVTGEIKNLTIEKAYIHPKDAEVDGASIWGGILAGSASGSILNCSVEGVVICEGYEYGGIVGSGGGEIADCSFTGRMIEKAGSSAANIGGIAGSGCSIRNCSVSAQIISEEVGDETVSCASIGGIVGISQSFVEDEVIENCTFEGEILSGDYAGGIVGHVSAWSSEGAGSKTIIRNCTNSGSITAAKDAGGIVGLALRPRELCEIQVDGCINRGEIKSLDQETCAAGGIVGQIDTNQSGLVLVSNCVNEAEMHAAMPGGIVGRVMQDSGNVRIENCTNKGAIYGEGSYAAGILCHIQQWGRNWNIEIAHCANEGNIYASRNAGGIVCFAYSVGNESGCEMTISNCANRGNLFSEGINNYMGGILGVNAISCVPVNVTGCTNEGDLEYTAEVLVDAETLSGALVTLSRTSGGIVGYVGSAPYIVVGSGERMVNNMNVENAFLNIENCASTGRFIHKEAAFADDVDVSAMENEVQEEVLKHFIALEGGIVGTVSDDSAYSVKIADCSYANVDREMDDWNRFDAEKND